MAMTSRLARLLEVQRRAILRRERETARQLAAQYRTIYATLQQQALDLAAQVQAARAAGQTVSDWQIWRLQRLQALQQQAMQQAAQFAQDAAALLTDAERAAMLAGQDDAYRLILAGLPDQAGALVTFAQLPTAAINAMAGMLADGSPLAALLQDAVGDAAQQFMQALVRGLALGWSPRKLARALADEFGMGLTRALRISRTELLRAYRTATLWEYRQSGVVTGWQRIAAKDQRTCMACILLDGKIYKNDEPMDDHVQGRCACAPLLPTWRDLGFDIDEPDWVRQGARDWFMEQPADVQQGMMGPGLFDAWQRGDVSLDDIPRQVRDPVWGDSWVVTPLRDLLAQAQGQRVAA